MPAASLIWNFTGTVLAALEPALTDLANTETVEFIQRCVLAELNKTTLLNALSTAITTGTTYRWDSALQGYIFNWSTKNLTAGVHRVHANLADGTKQFVNICLTK